MKKHYILGILFFSSLWGLSEAALGGALYRANVPHASVPLTIIAIVILSVARVYFPQKGAAVIIAALAMLYKFLNAPFFACHLLGILLTGICFEIFFGLFRIKNKSVCALSAAYASYASFALLITYVFRYDYWARAGFARVLSYVALDGTIAALVAAALIPLTFRLAAELKAKQPLPFALKLRPAQAGLLMLTAGLWVFGLAAYFFAV
jgi:hypothetical protein